MLLLVKLGTYVLTGLPAKKKCEFSVFVPGMKRKAKGMGAAESSESPSRRAKSSDEMSASSDEAMFPLPLEMLEEIFLNLPHIQVVHTCRLVCSQWKEVADSDSLWKERCRREGYHLRNGSSAPEDWRLFYFLCKKRRNLIKNPKGDNKMQSWQIKYNGGDKWKVDRLMTPHPDENVKKSFVTSYGLCMKSQQIDLVKEGYKPSFMDNFQPDIRISDWYGPRWDCGCEYNLCVELLDARQAVVQTFAPEAVFFEQWNDQQWNQITHVFRNYGPGVRYVRFNHGGKDTQFWAGWYGIRVTNSCVEICPAEDT